jgi:hypothetical protein
MGMVGLRDLALCRKGNLGDAARATSRPDGIIGGC